MTTNILITGASTGIGRAMSEYFAARDARVFAGVRNESDAPQHPNVVPVLMDVTDEHQVANAAAQVAAEVGGAGLTALVNNAGVAVGGPIEYIPIDDLRRQLEVNVVGQVIVTQAFLPMLREARNARILFTGSISGLMGIPALGPYVASKHALIGLAGSLRRELKPSAIGVSVLICGNIATPIWEKGSRDVDDIVESYPAEALERYGDLIDGMGKVTAESFGKGIPPEDVAVVAWKAITSKRPKERYLVGIEGKAVGYVVSKLPAPVLDRAMAAQLRA